MKRLLILGLLSFFSLMVPAMAYDYNPLGTASNINATLRYNTEIIQSGSNYMKFPCPDNNMTFVPAYLSNEAVIDKISHTNTTGTFQFIPDHIRWGSGTGNLTTMEYDKYYTIETSGTVSIICPCNYVTYAPSSTCDNSTNYVPAPWYGGICPTLGTTIGSDGLWIPQCLGLDPRESITTYYCSDENEVGNCDAWQVYSTSDDPALWSYQTFTPFERLWTCGNTTGIVNFTFGISCAEDLGDKVLITVMEDYRGAKLDDATISLIYEETGVISTAITDAGGLAVFNLTEEGWYGIKVEKDGYSQLYPYWQSALYYDGTTTGLTVSMHNLRSTDTAQLDVRVCGFNTTTEMVDAGNSFGNLYTPFFGYLFDYTTSLTTSTCLPLSDAMVTIGGNATGTKYTGYEGRVQFWDIEQNKSYNIAVNKTGYTQINPSFNNSYYLNDTWIDVLTVWMVDSSTLEGRSEATPAEDAVEFQESLVGAGTWFDAMIPTGMKSIIWIIMTILGGGGLALKSSWQMGIISIIALLLGGVMIGWMPSWIAILIVIPAGFILMRGGLSVFGGD